MSASATKTGEEREDISTDLTKRIGELERSLLIAPAKRCKNAGFSAKECKEAGHSLQQIRDAGYTIPECVKAGFLRADFLGVPRDLPILSSLDKKLFDEVSNSFPGGCRPTEVKRLVKLGANGSGYKNPNGGETALIFAANNNNSECVKLMLSTMSTDELTVADTNGMTALSGAAYYGNAKCVESLLQHMGRRGDDDARNDFNETLVTMKTYSGKTAKELAQDFATRNIRHTQVLEVFKKYETETASAVAASAASTAASASSGAKK